MARGGVTYIAPPRLRRAAMIYAAMAGMVLGLLGGLGFRFLGQGALDLAIVAWGLALVTCTSLLLNALQARALAGLTERGMTEHLRMLATLEDRIGRVERRHAEFVREPVVLDDFSDLDGADTPLRERTPA